MKTALWQAFVAAVAFSCFAMLGSQLNSPSKPLVDHVVGLIPFFIVSVVVIFAAIVLIKVFWVGATTMFSSRGMSTSKADPHRMIARMSSTSSSVGSAGERQTTTDQDSDVAKVEKDQTGKIIARSCPSCRAMNDKLYKTCFRCGILLPT